MDVLQIGSVGTRVHALQEALLADGVVGPRTAAAMASSRVPRRSARGSA